MRRFLVLALAVVMVLAITAPAMAGGKDGKAGKSNVTHCDFSVTDNDYSGPGWVQVQFKDLGDEMISFVLTGHGLMPGASYELKSGGSLSPAVEGVANNGGNLLLKGMTNPGGAHLNLFEDGIRILRTDKTTCLIP